MSHVNFLGIPVDGVITPSSRVPQLPLEDLQPLLRALLEDDDIVEFGWRQYTPYFNDGEPCIFRISEFWVRTTDDVDQGADELGVGRYAGPHPTLGDIGRSGWGNDAVDLPYAGTDEPRYRRARALADAFDAGAFCDVLLEAFGDHAHVTVRRTGISVAFYEHA